MRRELTPPLSSLTHGVYVIGVSAFNQKNAFTASWLMQSSFDPPLLALSINPAHKSYPLLTAGGFFSVNVLGKQQTDWVLHFGTPLRENKLATVEWHEAGSGVPILDAALAWFECEVVGEFPSGDHILVLGKIVNSELLDSMGLPLEYHEVSAIDPFTNSPPSTEKP